MALTVAYLSLLLVGLATCCYMKQKQSNLYNLYSSVFFAILLFVPIIVFSNLSTYFCQEIYNGFSMCSSEVFQTYCVLACFAMILFYVVTIAALFMTMFPCQEDVVRTKVPKKFNNLSKRNEKLKVSRSIKNVLFLDFNLIFCVFTL